MILLVTSATPPNKREDGGGQAGSAAPPSALRPTEAVSGRAPALIMKRDERGAVH